MENFQLPSNTSIPSIPKNNNNKNETKNYSSVTHPSMFSRGRHLESIFKKISSGDNVLSRIPKRLDPNVEFSDDEDEESAETVIKKPTLEGTGSKNALLRATEKENRQVHFAENVKTPEPPNYSGFEFKKVQSESRKMPDGLKNYHAIRSLSDTRNNHESKHLPVRSLLWFTPKNPSDDFPPPKPNDERATASKYKSPDRMNKDINPSKITDNATNNPSLSNDTIEVNGKIYNVLSLLGSGGSCKVFSVYDIKDKVRVAIKRVNLKDTDPSIRKGYEQEIEYLLKLQNSNRVIKMFDYEYRQDELLLVLEHGDIDLSKYLSNEAKLKRLTPLKIKFYWAQMLEAVAEIHKYGIVHSDLKPANFLLVAGNLKLIDFGIATSVPEDKTSTFRDTQVGTLNYMSPEAITQMSADSKQPCFKVGVKSDVWSLGCILYNLVYGVTPFHHIKSLMQKIYAITNPNYEIPFKPLSDPLLLDVLKSCLKRDPKERASVEELLKHPYLAEENSSTTNTEPVNPSQDLQNVLKQMQILTPRRMRYVTQVVQELSNKPNK